jgi:hypothetical protein
MFSVKETYAGPQTRYYFEVAKNKIEARRVSIAERNT